MRRETEHHSTRAPCPNWGRHDRGCVAVTADPSLAGILLQTTPGAGGPGLGGFADLITFVPRLIVALVALVIGIVIGIVVGGRVRSLSSRLGIGEAVMRTPLGEAIGQSASVDRLIGKLVQYYIYVLAAVVATSLAGFQRLLGFFRSLLAYAPDFIAAVVILLVGFVVGRYVGRAVRESEGARETGFAGLLGTLVEVIIYLIVVTIALDTAQLRTGVLETFAAAFAIALAVAVALAFGLAFGLGSREYVAENIEDWLSDGRDAAGDGDGEPEGTDGSGSS